MVFVQNFSNIKINYIYLECPKKEYYMVSNLTDSHEPEYIKPIGEFLVDFLNTDLTGYEEGLKKMYNLLCNTEIKSPIKFIFPVMDFIYPYLSQERFLFGAYVYYPLVCAFNKLAEYTEKKYPCKHSEESLQGVV